MLPSPRDRATASASGQRLAKRQELAHRCTDQRARLAGVGTARRVGVSKEWFPRV